MIIKAKIKKDDEWLFWEELPEMGSINTGLSEKHISINKHPIHITTYQIASNGFFVLCADVKASAPVDIISEIEGEAVVSRSLFTDLHSANIIFATFLLYMKSIPYGVVKISCTF